jgi:alpha-L-fucosidase 2
LDYYIHHYCTSSLFALCAGKMQVDGTFGVSAAVAEMLIQSHEGYIHLLPALPEAWESGEVKGLRARGGFVMDMAWDSGALQTAVIRAEKGGLCRIRASRPVRVFQNGVETACSRTPDGLAEWETHLNDMYQIVPEGASR